MTMTETVEMTMETATKVPTKKTEKIPITAKQFCLVVEEKMMSNNLTLKSFHKLKTMTAIRKELEHY